jgi:hypothetical protein
VTAPFVFAGATDTEAFRFYAGRVLAPELRPGDVVVWDNLRPHKDAEAIRAVEEAGNYAVGRGRGLREAAAVGLPLGQDAGVLLAALRGAVAAEEDVAAAAEAVGQGDDGLAALLVEAVNGNVVTAGHSPEPPCAEEFRAVSGFQAALPTVGMYAKLRSAKDLCQWALQDSNL